MTFGLNCMEFYMYVLESRLELFELGLLCYGKPKYLNGWKNIDS